MSSTREHQPIFGSLPGGGNYPIESYSKCERQHNFKDKLKMVKKMGKGRARTMMIGATSIINKWPDNLLFCWLASVFFIMIVVGCMLTLSSMVKHSQDTLNDQEKCLLRHTHASERSDENVFLHIMVNNNDNFDIEKYKDILKTAIQIHPRYTINILILFNDLLHYDFKRNSRLKTWQTYHNGAYQYSFFGTSSAERDEGTTVNFLRLDNEPNIKIVQSTFSNFFKHSPLSDIWRNIPQDILPVAMRMLSIWEHGGIAVSWNLFLDKNQLPKRDPATDSAWQERLNELKRSFSSSVIKSRNLFEIKKTLLDKLKENLKSQPVGSDSDISLSSDLYELYKSIMKGGAIPRFDENKKYHSRSHFPTGTEESATGSIPYDDEASGDDESYYYESESVAVYSPSGDDGLPRSYESKSGELRIRPQLSPEYVKEEIMRFVNRKKTGISKEVRVKTGRSLLAAVYSEMLNSEESDEDVCDPSDYYDYDTSTEKPPEDKIRNPFDELVEKGSIEFMKGVGFVKTKSPVQKLQEKLASTYSTESRSSALSNDPPGSSSASSESMSLETMRKFFGPISEEHYDPHLYIKEKKGYKDNSAFDYVNIFSLPSALSVTLDQSGYYMSVKRPCNEFIAELIKLLKNTTDFVSPDEFITQGMVNYCRTTDFSKCAGITILEEDYL